MISNDINFRWSHGCHNKSTKIETSSIIITLFGNIPRLIEHAI